MRCSFTNDILYCIRVVKKINSFIQNAWLEQCRAGVDRLPAMQSACLYCLCWSLKPFLFVCDLRFTEWTVCYFVPELCGGQLTSEPPVLPQWADSSQLRPFLWNYFFMNYPLPLQRSQWLFGLCYRIWVSSHHPYTNSCSNLSLPVLFCIDFIFSCFLELYLQQMNIKASESHSTTNKTLHCTFTPLLLHRLKLMTLVCKTKELRIKTPKH
jgi:hypothetical protein